MSPGAQAPPTPCLDRCPARAPPHLPIEGWANSSKLLPRRYAALEEGQLPGSVAFGARGPTLRRKVGG
eukprot:1047590-Alexandrium_andersonii.AAC.1